MLSYEYIDPDKMIASPEFKVIEGFINSTGRRNTGWHYITDLTWIYRIVQSWPRGINILDAGGGNSGPLQFLLAELGFNVTNIDLFLPPPKYQHIKRYGMRLTTSEHYSPTTYVEHLNRASLVRKLKRFISKILNIPPINHIESIKYCRLHEKWRKEEGISASIGRIEWIRGNLCNLSDIPNARFDAVVSLSALEHIPIDQLQTAMNSIKRIVKPLGTWAITTSATHKLETWFHTQSQGYCYSSDDLKILFGASGNDIAEQILNKYRNNLYLKKNLPIHYKFSKNNGMPWGIWNPEYIPVGLTNCSDY